MKGSLVKKCMLTVLTALVVLLGGGIATAASSQSSNTNATTLVEANDSPEMVEVAVKAPSLSTCQNQMLSTGSSGDCVKSVQESLRALGYQKVLKADGRYGARTRLAVFYYQSWASLPADGVAGPITLRNLNLDANRPTPAGRAAELPKMPDNSAVFSPNGGGIQVAGTASTTSYFGRRATRQLNDALNKPGVDWTTGQAATAFCAAVGLAWSASTTPVGGKVAGILCSQAVAAQIFLIKTALDQAMQSNGCFTIKTNLITKWSDYLPNAGHNCIP